MATVTRFPFISYLRSDTTMHIQHVRGGELRHSGAAAGFWFSPRTAVLAEVPIGDREQAMVLHARTADFQDVAVQATATYRVTDPATAAGRFEFDIDPVTGQWRATPLEVVGGLLTEIVQQPALALAATMDLRRILADGVVRIRDAVTAALAVDDLRVTAIRTAADVEKALATQTRESVQQDADRATFERRALAVERERAIAENEMQNQIELAKREEQLVNQRGQNGRLAATEQAAADRIAAESAAQRVRIAGEAHADEVRIVGEADAAAQAASLAAFRDIDHETLLALALRDLAKNLPEITNLTVTPDLLTEALGRFAGRA